MGLYVGGSRCEIGAVVMEVVVFFTCTLPDVTRSAVSLGGRVGPCNRRSSPCMYHTSAPSFSVC